MDPDDDPSLDYLMGTNLGNITMLVSIHMLWRHVSKPLFVMVNETRPVEMPAIVNAPFVSDSANRPASAPSVTSMRALVMRG